MTIDARELLLALGETTNSGSALADRFGVTRAAVWKQIESLRALGAPIVARAGQGYRLDHAVDLLDAERIRAGLHARPGGRSCSVDVRWQVDSTNSELLRRVQAGDECIGACFAELQSAGRGRRGRAWHTPLGGGLALSVHRGFNSSMSALAGLSLAVGIGMVRALAECGYAGVGLKWPNDLQLDGRKLAGILVELGGDALGPCHAVIGVGLNMRLDAQMATTIDQPWTDLAACAATPLPERNQLAACVLGHLLDVLEQFAIGTFSSFVEEFARYDVLRGQAVAVVNGHQRRTGRALGVDHTGVLHIRDDEGEFLVDSGEVSVRAMAGIPS